MSGDNASSADNQQETLYYFSGFLTGEGSICLIKATNKGGRGFYYTPDLTISNADLDILKESNQVIAGGHGVITSIKGGFNLSIRGKNKVKTAITFLQKYPPIVGDITSEKISILVNGVALLSSVYDFKEIEKLRDRLKEIKRTAKATKHFTCKKHNRKQIGYFLAGIVDAEGSMGWRKSGDRLQPYFCVLMREEAIIDLFLKYFGFGHKYYRPAEKLYHFETGKQVDVLSLANFFLENCPVKLAKNKRRLEDLQRLLNDYTPRSSAGWRRNVI